MTFSLRAVALVLFIAVLTAPTLPAHAAEIPVACGAAELIAAINTANGTPEADTLTLAAACTYTFSEGDATNSDSALPRITSDITINGSGAILERDSQFNFFRMFYVEGDLTLNDMSINDPDASAFGGAIYSEGVLNLDSVTITGARSTGSGGGLYNAGTATLTSVTITDPLAGGGSGAGIYNIGSLVLTDGTITGGNATAYGGAIVNAQGGDLTVTNTTISGNTAGSGGGGVFNFNFSTMDISNSTISGNTSDNTFDAEVDGGGILNSSATMTLTNVTLTGNTAEGDGGGIANMSSGTLNVQNSTLSGNSAYRGGAIFTNGSTTVTSSVISGNTASFTSGGIFNASGLTVLNSTIAGNGDMGINGLGSIAVKNSILWGNESTLSFTAAFSDSIIEGGWASGTNVRDVDPLFVALEPFANAPTAAGDYHLQPSSPAIDTGSNADVVGATDIDGDARILYDVVDLGADEADYCTAFVFPYTVTGGDTAELKTAVRCANANPDASVINLTTSVYNFTVGDALVSDNALPPITTPITINGNSATIQRDSGAPTNFRLIAIDAAGSLTLDNVTLQNGSTDGAGGAVLNEGALTITNSTLQNNTADSAGGGLSIAASATATASNLTLSGNLAAALGGGINNAGAVTLLDVNITENTTGASGICAAIYNQGTLTLTSGNIVGNEISDLGIVCNETAAATLTINNTLIAGNAAFTHIVVNIEGTMTFNNVAIAGNYASSSGAGIVNLIGPPIVLNNTLIYGNEAPSDPNVAGDYTATNSLIGVDPSFVAPLDASDTAPTLDGDYRLMPGSAAANVGSNALVPPGVMVDLDGNPRIIAGVVDIGAYELPPVNLLTNPGFEMGLLPWEIASWQKDKVKVKPEKAAEGAAAFKFKGYAGKTSGKIKQKIDNPSITDGASFVLTAQIDGGPFAVGKVILKVKTDQGGKFVEKLDVAQTGDYALHEIIVPVTLADGELVTNAVVIFNDKSQRSKVFVDAVSLTVDASPAPRGAREPGLLPPPAAPDGFRGQN